MKKDVDKVIAITVKKNNICIIGSSNFLFMVKYMIIMHNNASEIETFVFKIT